jgi:amino acid adenylation domain-containing protein
MHNQIVGFRLSPAQTRLWRLQQDAAAAYHSQCVVMTEGLLAEEILEQAVGEVVERHEILRTRFHRAPGLKFPIQVIEDRAVVIIRRLDLSGLPVREQESELAALAQAERTSPYDFEKTPLLRAHLLKLTPARHALLLTLPALCADTQTLINLAREISLSYVAPTAGGETREEAVPYVQFSEWQNELLEQEDAEAGKEFWRSQEVFDHPALTVSWPFQTKTGGETAYLPQTFGLSLSREATARLHDAARSLDATPDAILLACWQTLLWRLTGQKQIITGVVCDGRKYEELRGALGLFACALPAPARFAPSDTFAEALSRMKETLGNASDWQEYFSWEETGDEFAETGHFSNGFEFIELPVPQSAGGVMFSLKEADACTERFELKLRCVERDRRLRLEMHYDAGRVGAAQVERLAAQFSTLLESALAAPRKKLAALDLIGAQELRQLLVQWNDTAAPYPRGLCLHELFERQAALSPSAVALECGTERLTYRELNARANQLAAHLRACGVGAEVLVGVLMERSVELVVALLGVLKAGGAYLPVDATYPVERVRFMLEDAGVRVVLTHAAVDARQLLGGDGALGGARVVRLDEQREVIAAHDPRDVGGAATAENLAYVIYTSGSTGRPKGVMVTHGGLVNYLHWALTAYAVAEGDGTLLHSPLGFDLTVTSLYAPLLTGRTLRLVSEAEGLEALSAAVRRSAGLSLLKVTPAHLTVLSQWLPAAEAAGRARALVIGGEALTYEQLAYWQAHAPGTRLINEYGPTETVVGCCVYEVKAGAGEAGGVPIGRPIANTQIYILDEGMEPTPVGVAGELYIGGAGVARGYLKRAGQTAERFVPDAFGSEGGGRLYRTGDVGRYREDGEVEYVGRSDHQVKVRGYRIELGEVEEVLRGHAGVREAVVEVRGEGVERRLVAYVVWEEEESGTGGGLRAEEIRAWMGERVPEWMVPGAVVMLKEMPLTDNGKVDRHALPAPGAGRPELEEAYVAPQTPSEEILAAIWAEVLGIEQIGTNDNFFAFGGDSIRSVRVVALAKERGLNFTVEDLFQHQTIGRLVREVEMSQECETPDLYTEPLSLIGEEDRNKLPGDVEDAYPLTMLQAGMLYHLELTPDSPAYHNVNSYHIRGRFGAREMQEAVRQVVARHAALRTSFDLTSYSEPLQLVHRAAVLPVVIKDLRHLSFKEQEEELSAFVEGERRNFFDLLRAPLIRIHVHLRSDETFQFSFTELHPVSDGWSTTSMFAEIFRRMTALLNGEPVPDQTPPATSFRDYIAQERKALRSENFRRFWDENLKDCVPMKLPRWPASMRDASITGAHADEVLNTSQLFKWPDGEAHTRQQRWDFPLSQEIADGLKRLARKAAVPLKTVLLAAHLKVMSVLSGQTDVVTGLSSNGRPDVLGGEEVRGLFLNTLPFRLDLAGGSWLDLVKRTFKAEGDLLPLRRYPMAALQQERGLQPLCETLFGYLHFHAVEGVMQEGEMELLDHGNIDWSETNFTLLTIFHKGPFPNSFPHELMLMLTYDTEQICEEQAKAIHGYYDSVLKAMATEPQGQHEAAAFLSGKEQHQLLVSWNETAADYPRGQCIHQLFEEQVGRTPEAVAVRFGEEELSYRELNGLANRLAHRLREMGVVPDSLVGVYLERSAQMIVGLLGILKAGGAYLPLDLNYPEQRLAFMLEDAAVGVVLTRSGLIARLPDCGARLVCLDDETGGAAEEGDAANPSNRTTGENLAYAIYTSGSTGTPKGIEIPHRAVNRLIVNTDYVKPEGGDRFAQASNSSFDAATFEIWGALLSGGRLIGATKELALSPERFAGYLNEQEITTLFLTTALFNQCAGATPAAFNGVRDLLFGGEACDPGRVARVLATGGPTRLVHVYGPTESTTFATWKLIEEVPEGATTIPIGRPIANTQIYILDRNAQPVPIGVDGELYIGGDGLARGYLNRPELTAAQFVPHPFSDESGARLYRTGDLAHYLPNADIEFVGRIDQQVKIRGFRIEVGEIEAALTQHPLVGEAVVLARADERGEKKLVAYVAGARDEQSFVIGELRRHLREKLPEYMVPGLFLLLDALPLTPNGKVDRAALPAPDYSRPDQNDNYVTPRTPVEEMLAGILSQVLGVERVGAGDNFFELGGHSLHASNIMARVRESFQVEMPLRALFEQSTVSELAASIEQEIEAGHQLQTPPIVAVARDGHAPLSFSQQRLWFLGQLEQSTAAYNILAAMRMIGPLDVGALERSLGEIVRRHESLRTRFVKVDGQPVQLVEDAMPVRFEVTDLSTLPETEWEAETMRLAREEASSEFDLARAPLLRAKLLTRGADDHVALLSTHHIVSDGWSMGVFVRELGALYEAYARGADSPLPELAVQYADYATWQREWLRGEVLERQVGYWKRQLEGAPPVLELPTDRPRPATQSFRGAMLPVAVPQSLTEALKDLSRREEVTLYMTLLAAFKILLWHRSRLTDIVVGTPVANRNRVETEEVIGFFVNTLVLRTDLAGDPSFRELLKRIRETALGAYAHQALPFEKLVEELKPERDPGRHAVFQVMFGLHTLPAAPLELAGLQLIPFEIDNTTAKFDLLVNLEETPQGLAGNLEYSTDLFEASTAAAMLEDYKLLLQLVVEQADARLSQLGETIAEDARRRDALKEEGLAETRRLKYKKIKRRPLVGTYEV